MPLLWTFVIVWLSISSRIWLKSYKYWQTNHNKHNIINKIYFGCYWNLLMRLMSLMILMQSRHFIKQNEEINGKFFSRLTNCHLLCLKWSSRLNFTTWENNTSHNKNKKEFSSYIISILTLITITNSPKKLQKYKTKICYKEEAPHKLDNFITLPSKAIDKRKKKKM